MNTIKTFIPSDLVETFEKFASKAKKNVALIPQHFDLTLFISS